MFVTRDKDDNIVALWAAKQDFAAEEIADDDPEVLAFLTPPIGPLDVDAERDRRIASGFRFLGSLFQSRPEDRENIMGASTAALAAMMTGALPGDLRWHGGDSDFAWIDAENVMHPMDAQTVFELGKVAMAHKQAHIFAARAIKDMPVIPADFTTNETYWP